MDGKVELDSMFEPKKCQKRYDDGMSKIYDDLIIKILSCLPLKDAVRTSVLSSRWINLWKHISRLNFDLDCALKSKIAEPRELKKWKKVVEKERRKYVDWVNTVLQSHRAPRLEEFSVSLDLSRSHENEITRWLEFALAKKVRRLELDLKIGFYEVRPLKNYSFPEELLTRIDFKSLRELSLIFVNVTGEAIEFFLLKCPFLEKLVVRGTHTISNVRVCGESLMLKHLELDNCYHIESVKVSAPNLSSLTVLIFEGLSLKNVPMLVEVSGTFIWYSIKYLSPALACCISRLEILHLKLRYSKKNVEENECLVHHKFPEMPKLKKLFICYSDTGDEGLIGLTSLIRASPNLHEFCLEVIWEDLSRSDREIKSSVKLFHQSLQVFKFCGYYGRVSDVELVMVNTSIPRLDFDLDSALKSKIAEVQEKQKWKKVVEKERRKYVDWVLQSHRAPSLEEFSVCLELSRSHENEITRWLEFAFAKKVRRLELDLKIGLYENRPVGNCSFPEELLTRIDIKSLRELSLIFVNVTGEAIEFFLLKCPFLEKIVVRGTCTISNVQVCGGSFMLKHLELDKCDHIQSVEVSAPNLSSLTVPIFKGLSLKNVPMLVEVSVTFINLYSIKNLFPTLACCISRLEILHLKFLYVKKNVEDSKSLVHHKFPEMPKLKKLFIHYWDTGDESLIGLTSLIRALPNLH